VTVQVPTPTSVMVVPLVPPAAQTLLGPAVNVTGLFDAPPLAATGYVPPTRAGLGGGEVKATVCGAWVIMSVPDW
jgi:hypothetical protein